MTTTTSRYTGGSSGWGQLESYCICGELVGVYNVDENGSIVEVVWEDNDHVCGE